MRTIGIQFDQESMALYLPDQGRKIDIQGGFSTGDANPVNPILEAPEATQNVFQWNGRILLRMKGEGMVVAVRAAEIAMGKEEDSA
jgi:hypothetical protein